MHIHFVTGCLAEPALRGVLGALAPHAGFAYSVQVLPITVAALMTPAWIAPRLVVPPEADQVLLPGYCGGDLAPLNAVCAVPVVIGPRDLRKLPQFFGQDPHQDYGGYNIQILAEINHAPRLARAEILAMARQLAADGADLIDLGCDPNHIWTDAGDTVRRLRDAGLRVSIDSLEPANIAPAVAAGAELVLSVNSSNRQHAADWGCEVVAIPDQPTDMDSLDRTVEYLAARNVRLRLDPILEPIGFGFAASLQRYAVARQRYPDAEMLMGIGNLTELTDADSAAINLLLLAYCQELGIRGVLTTQVINWARGSVRECDLARRAAYYAVEKRTLPKHLEPRLVPLRGDPPRPFGEENLIQLAASLRDNNYRIFAEAGQIHLLWAGHHLSGGDPFELFARLLDTRPTNIDAGHAFYLGYEFCKAVTALTLHKHYEQDTALNWGYLTKEEQHHRLSRRSARERLEQRQSEAEQAAPPLSDTAADAESRGML
ncbi:MAG: DUF6513 domain-containing protein [Pirellulales bacterium]|nr:DUF6513 domain-containing protein [Pirellulales bacterium]